MSVYSINGYRVDVFLRVTPTQGGEVAGDELEDGSRYTDHFARNADGLVVEGVVSDDPVGEMVDVRIAERAGTTQGGYRASVFARQRIEQILADELPVDVVTPARTYRGFFLASWTADEHPSEFRFSATFSQARLVKLTRELVKVPTAAGKRNLGVDPIGNLAKGLARAGKELLADLAGEPVQVYDRSGKPSAWYSPTLKTWYASDGSVVDPLNAEDQERVKRGNTPYFDPKTKQVMTAGGVPVTKSSAPNPQKNFTDTGFASTPGGKITALQPAWKKNFGATR